ncbi:MAG: response regulator receiver protein [Solirubrobacterales bacterium]|nr:response regulator receiver protein [Solirubrobacterales bacterium]
MSQKHILLVDDEDDIREVAAISLQAVGGWRVSCASSGADGIAKAIAERPDAILLDVMMPDVDGPTTFKRLWDDPQTRDIPVILLTAKAQAADRHRFEELGVAGVLTKPFDPMTLSDEVAAILAPRSSRPVTGSQVPAVVQAVFEDSRDELARRVQTLDEAVAAVVEGHLDEHRRAGAASVAHTLTGLLGMFGLPRGSELARELEHAFGVLDGPALSEAPRLAGLVLALRSQLDPHTGVAS